MLHTPSTRRTFLRALGTSVAGASLASRFARVQEGLAAEVGGVVFDGSDPDAVRQLRARYLLDPDILFLNHASIGTVPAAVLDACRRYMELCESNPWLYMWGGAWEEGREDARRSVAGLLSADPEDVALTHNTTEGFNLLARGLPLGPGDEVLFSSLNHDGASVCWQHASVERGFRVRRFPFPVDDVTGMSADDVVAVHAARIRDETRVLVFPHVDNAVGLRHPLEALTRMAHARGVDVVAVDGAQTVGMIPLDLPDSGVDAYAGSPHKWVQAPKGLGVFYVRPETRESLRPMWVTWGQRRWAGTVRVLEDYGTRNLPETLALADAVRFQETLGALEKERRLVRTWTRMRARVEADPGLEWRSPGSWERGASLVAVHVRGRPAAEMGGALWRDHGVVVRAFGGGGSDHLRVSPNVMTTDGEVDRFFRLLEAGPRP